MRLVQMLVRLLEKRYLTKLEAYCERASTGDATTKCDNQSALRGSLHLAARTIKLRQQHQHYLRF
jgi:hypothetical protein